MRFLQSVPGHAVTQGEKQLRQCARLDLVDKRGLRDVPMHGVEPPILFKQGRCPTTGAGEISCVDPDRRFLVHKHVWYCALRAFDFTGCLGLEPLEITNVLVAVFCYWLMQCVGKQNHVF